MPQFKPRRRFVMARSRAAGLRSRARAGLILLSAGILLLLVIMALLTRFNPLIAQFAVSNSGDVITRIVNDSVTEVTAAENIGYDDLVTLKRDEAGNITALVTNMASINRLQAEISNTVIEKLNENDVETVRVPLGNLIGGVMFSGRGPNTHTSRFSAAVCSARIRKSRICNPGKIAVTLCISIILFSFWFCNIKTVRRNLRTVLCLFQCKRGLSRFQDAFHKGGVGSQVLKDQPLFTFADHMKQIGLTGDQLCFIR